MLTTEHLTIRKTGIGGSNVAAILGISPFKNETPLKIYLDKISNEIPEQTQNVYQYYGTKMEPLLGEIYNEFTGNKIIKPDQKVYRHPKFDFMIGSPDFFAEKKGNKIVLECKTTGKYKDNQWGEEGTADIPLYYLTQVAHYAILFDTTVDIIVNIDREFKIYNYNRDEELERQIIEKETNFWNDHVLKRIPPPAANSDDLLRLFPASKSIVKIATNEADEAYWNLKRKKEELKKLEQECEILEFKIQENMQDADCLIDIKGNKLATWKTSTRDYFKSSVLKIDCPELYDQYLNTKEVRTFRTYNIKEE